MTESGKIGSRTRREFTLIGVHDRASADEQIRQICVHGARCLLGLSAVQIGGSASAGCIADVYRSAGSARLAVEAQLARR